MTTPLSFLLWFVGWKNQRGRNRCFPITGTQRRKRAWGGALVGSNVGMSSVQATGESMGCDEAMVRLAALGDAGRLAAFDKLQELQQEGACCDVTLAIGGRHFKAHKYEILCCAVKYQGTSRRNK